MRWLMWLVTGLAVFGNVLVIRRRRAGFGVWVVCNCVLAWRNASGGEYAQAALWTVYLGMAVWGWMSWREER